DQGQYPAPPDAIADRRLHESGRRRSRDDHRPGRLEDLLETLTDGSHQLLDGTAPVTDHRAGLGGEHIGMDFGWTGKPKAAWQQGRHLTTPSMPVGAGRPGVGTGLT